MSNWRDRFPGSWPYYDIQFGFILNPLNWEISNGEFGGIRRLCFGPFWVILYYGG